MTEVLITHGTDITYHTSAALSFMLKGCTKTVALTGSQIAVGREGSDAPKNVYDAAGLQPTAISEYALYLAQKIIKGTRAMKTSASDTDAFDSFCSPLLGSTKRNPHFRSSK